MSKEDAVSGITETVEDVAGSMKKTYGSVREVICSVPLIGEAFQYIETPIVAAFAMWLMWTVVAAIGWTMPGVNIAGLTLGESYLHNLTAFAALRFAKTAWDNYHPFNASDSK